MMEIKSFKYSDGKTPEGYVCKCGASNVRLYREYQTFLDHQELTCTACAIIRYNESHKQPWESQGKNHSIGWVVAAVPTEDGTTFWGFTSIPQDGVDWWDNLPQKILEPLTPKTVQDIFFDCLFTDDEVKDLEPGHAPPEAVLVHGVTVKVGMHKARLDKHKEEIKELLSQLPNAFYHDKGGGLSFLNLPFLNDEVTQWGEHESAQQLMLLGIASGLMKYCAPESVWAALPGGVPYVVVNLDGF